MRHISLFDGLLELDGMPWYAHNGNRLIRLPVQVEGQISRELWTRSQDTSGARIRFCSDTTSLGLRLNYPHAITEDEITFESWMVSVDAYVDGYFWSRLVPNKEGAFEGMFFQDVTKQSRQITLYLPQYHAVEKPELLVDDNATILPPVPFAIPRPVVFYGTSITQGGCASRPGLTYPARVCRELNLDFVNLGFSAR